jgi:hypothetical protein
VSSLQLQKIGFRPEMNDRISGGQQKLENGFHG